VPEQIRRHVELDLRLQLGYCVQAARGYADAEVADAYQRARELCSMLGDTAELYPVLRGLYVFYTVRCEFDAALELAKHCVRLGNETYKKDKKRPEYLIEGYDALGYVLFYQGDLQGAFKTFSDCVALYRAHDGHRLNYPFVPQDPAVAALSALAICSWLLGETAKASRCAEEVLALAEMLNRPFDRAYAHCFVAMLENIRRQPQRALEHAGKTVNIAQEYGFTIWLGAGTLHLAIAMGALGQSAQALAYLTPALGGWEGCGAKLNLSFFLAGLSETQRAAGNTDLALAAVEKAIAHATEHNEHFYDAALYRIRAELWAASGGTANQLAEKDFVRSHEIAQRQGARMLELLTATRWHRWALSSGGPSRSRGALQAAYAALSEAGATGQELQEAEELLAEPQKA
jgi:tetratricopeptide (TPR) repeat protein